MVPSEPQRVGAHVISRILPLIASVTTRLPRGTRRAYGDLSNRFIEASSLHHDFRSTVAEMGSAPVDAEGVEWGALLDVHFHPFQQVLLEMHDLRRLQDVDAADAVWQTTRGLASTHYPIHVHANNERPFNRFDRYWFPDVIELSYVRKDRLAQPRPSDVIETLTDRATNPAYPDYDVSGLLTVAPSPLFC